MWRSRQAASSSLFGCSQATSKAPSCHVSPHTATQPPIRHLQGLGSGYYALQARGIDLAGNIGNYTLSEPFQVGAGAAVSTVLTASK